MFLVWKMMGVNNLSEFRDKVNNDFYSDNTESDNLQIVLNLSLSWYLWRRSGWSIAGSFADFFLNTLNGSKNVGVS